MPQPMFKLACRIILFLSFCGSRSTSSEASHEGVFLVTPFVQNPTGQEITLRWVTNTSTAGQVRIKVNGAQRELDSKPSLCDRLGDNIFGHEPRKTEPQPAFMHSVLIAELSAGTTYEYQVQQQGISFRGNFQTTPDENTPIRFAAFSDSETEPESSTSPPVSWPVANGVNRPAGIENYIANQTIGYQENLKIIAERKPNFLCITGDLVESGGEQRDWDEFWRHVAGNYGTLAGSCPIFPAIGNHENFGGPGAFGGYSAEASNFGVGKYLTYFEVPSNGASRPEHHGRYYRIDYGPITLITLDSSDGLPHQTASDTNHSLSGSYAPDFNPGSEQYLWLEKQLQDAQQKARFTFVQFHHTPYGSGPHSVPFGKEGFSGQSGIAMRVLTPLFQSYGVDVVLCGHDEMQERSLVPGVEKLPDGTEREHQIHFFDVGMGGDGLRGPSKNAENPFRKYLAHTDNPEVWDGRRLVSGGKHYGHLEVNVAPDDKGKWKVTIEPVHAFPLMNSDGQVTGWERRVCNDVVVIPQQ